jgi:hypothetical protein
VKRLSATAALLLFASSPALAAQPFDGEWYLECGSQTGDMVPTVIEDGTIVRHESDCDITDTAPIGAHGQAWRVTASCEGKGEKWIEHMILGLDLDVDQKPRQLVTIDMDKGLVLAYQKCD